MEHNRRRVDFIDAITHELKTSLTAIIASADLLGEELHLDRDSVLGKLVASILRNARTMNGELTRLSQASGDLVSGLQLQLEPVGMGEVIRNAALRVYPQVQQKQQSLSLDLPDSLPAVKGDRLYLEGVVHALLDNAAKFTGEKGSITAAARRNGDSLVVDISDTGIGIPAQEQERIFQPHYQVSPAGGENTVAGGLGLAVIKPLIERHGGEIWLESTVGEGTNFSFSLPVSE